MNTSRKTIPRFPLSDGEYRRPLTREIARLPVVRGDGFPWDVDFAVCRSS